MDYPKLKWVYARIGQMTSFAVGGVILIFPPNADVSSAITGAALLGTGLVLRHQMYATGRDKFHINDKNINRMEKT